MKRMDIISEIGRVVDAKRYLEIGVSLGGCFDNVSFDYKVSVDPKFAATKRMTSDDFFATNDEIFDIIFIDGLHLEDQVMRDFENSLKILSPNGAIVIHDCLPLNEETGGPRMLQYTWHGTVWRAWTRIRMSHGVDVFSMCVDTDEGCGVFIPSFEPVIPPQEIISDFNMSVAQYRSDPYLRGAVSGDEFLKYLNVAKKK